MIVIAVYDNDNDSDTIIVILAMVELKIASSSRGWMCLKAKTEATLMSPSHLWVINAS